MNGLKQLNVLIAENELARVRELADSLFAEEEPSEVEFVDAIADATDLLPNRVRAQIGRFRRSEAWPLLRVSAPTIVNGEPGPTPAHWRDSARRATRYVDALMISIGATLGDPFGWATQQDGRLIHDILPIQGLETEQLGASSRGRLTWHTEDAFHPGRADYVLLGCIRNPQEAATDIGWLGAEGLSSEDRRVLREKRFFILPDNSHLAKNNTVESIDGTFSHMEEMFKNPEPVAVIFGDREVPYLRIDPDFMTAAPEDDDGKAALDAVSRCIERSLSPVVLGPGDVVVLDNYQVVHGRSSFEPRYDGTDRWLRRVNVARDLRRSHEFAADHRNRLLA